MTDAKVAALLREYNASKLMVSTTLYLEFEQNVLNGLLREYQGDCASGDGRVAICARATDLCDRIMQTFSSLVSAGDAREIEEIRYRLDMMRMTFAMMNIRLGTGVEEMLAHVVQHGPPPPTK
jgi:hypothetical protein